MRSDRGSQLRSHAYVQRCAERSSAARWAGSGACGDNAAMESFFSLLQKNVLNRQRWQTCGELRLAIVVWIERTYHAADAKTPSDA